MQAYRCPGLSFKHPELGQSPALGPNTPAVALFQLRGSTPARTNTFPFGGICYSGIARAFARQPMSNKLWHAYPSGYVSQLWTPDHLLCEAQTRCL